MFIVCVVVCACVYAAGLVEDYGRNTFYYVTGCVAEKMNFQTPTNRVSSFEFNAFGRGMIIK